MLLSAGARSLLEPPELPKMQFRQRLEIKMSADGQVGPQWVATMQEADDFRDCGGMSGFGSGAIQQSADLPYEPGRWGCL
eukprot:CAMPEP_0172197608 /NCGR_PEP_ID=MMETSP1050-20130122/27567_1 /TAXON_ID=233186 /ORGANISM="Cryptomonas curvata, Strain CCAP979/52" /LENGTH=79 /DNA_ID=CAMNT_0012874219 /DNA_START=1 /DNA_END=237 /DNA_ORIENTATION=-